MIFSLLIIILAGVIGYFYYAQGFLTALTSAVSAVIAAVIAVSYHENLEAYAFTTRMTDVGAAFSLVVLFAVTFVALRMTFDAAIPGNIRLPLLMDRIGAGIFGAVIGIFSTGIFAVAAQTLPFGPSVMGQARFKLSNSREVTVPTARQAQDEEITDPLASDTFSDDDRQSLFLPVDQWVLGFVSYLSDGGSLAGARTFASVHPNYLDELFGQRIGIQPGGAHVAVNAPGAKTAQVSVPLAYLPAKLAEADSEIHQLRDGALKTLKPTLNADDHNVIVVIRVMFSLNASDEDKLVRFSTGGIRLNANGTDYYPLGTLDDAGVLRMNKPDDFLLVNEADGDHGADVVFYVPKTDILQPGDAKKPSFAPGVFLQVKRMALFDLSQVEIKPPQAPDKSLEVLRKKDIPAPTAQVDILSAAPSDLGDSAPFIFDHLDVSPTLFTPISVGLYDADPSGAAVSVSFGSGIAFVKNKQFSKLALTANTPLAQLPVGDNAIDTLFVPPGMKAVQLVGTLPPKTDDPWTWAEHLGDLTLADANGKSYKPSGVLAKGMKSIQPVAIGKYDSETPIDAFAKADGVRPTDVILIYLVPSGTNLTELDYQGKRLATLNKSIGD
jgi:uncharacterized membrane protein required for colicin V production